MDEICGVSTVIGEGWRRRVCTGLVTQGELDEAMVSDESARGWEAFRSV